MRKRWQSLLLLLVSAIWIAQPALACLAPAQSASNQMECCRQTSGDCDMSGMNSSAASESCCKHTVRLDPAAPINFGQPHIEVVPNLAHLSDIAIALQRVELVRRIGERPDSPPESPPTSVTVLRI